MFFLSILVIFTLLIIYGTFIEPHWLKVNRISLRSFNNQISLNKRLVILFDPHIKRIGRRERKIINLVLAGHTHGGQIWMPKALLRGLYRLLDHDLKYPRGYFQQAQTTMYVSTGLGESVIPLRIGIRPEICII